MNVFSPHKWKNYNESEIIKRELFAHAEKNCSKASQGFTLQEHSQGNTIRAHTDVCRTTTIWSLR